MSVPPYLDGRHRWGDPVRDGIMLVYTCRACGWVVSFETLIPDAMVAAILRAQGAILRAQGKDNPYRDLFR